MAPAFPKSSGTTARARGSWRIDLLGYNYRMTDLQGLGQVQLAKLDGFYRRACPLGQQFYREQLRSEWKAGPAGGAAGARHGWQSFVTWVDPAMRPCRATT